MKKNALLIAGSVLLIILLLLFFLPVQFNVTGKIHISSPIKIVSTQISDLHNWVHWHPSLNTEDADSIHYSGNGTTALSTLRTKNDLQITFLRVNPAEALVKEIYNGKTSYQNIIAVPDSFGMATNISWSKSLSPIDWIKEQLNPSPEISTGLKKLKLFSENTEYAYGFHIVSGNVIDTLVVTKRKVVDESEKLNAVKGLFSILKEYVTSNHLTNSNIRMASFSYPGNGKVEVYVAIPVQKEIKETEGIKYQKLPPNGKILVGEYNGPYSSLNKLYNAMEQYIIDKTLQKIARNYERYLTDPVTYEDSLHMKLELVYPIF